MRELRMLGGLCSLVSLAVWFWGFTRIQEATTESAPDYNLLYDGLSFYFLAVVLCLLGIAMILMERGTGSGK